MATKQIKYCDICGATDALTTLTDEIGQEYDGHRNDTEYVSVDLCQICLQKLDWLCGNLIAVHSIGVSRLFDKSTTRKILLLLARNGKLKL